MLLTLIKLLLELDILKDIIRGVGNGIKDIILEFGEFDSIVSLGLDTLLSVLILHSLLNSNNLIEHLIDETFWSDLEVKDGHLDTDLWAVVRRWHLCGDVELEVIVIGDDLISELHQELITLLLNLLAKQWVEGWVEVLSSILKDDWNTVLDGVLKDSVHNLWIHGWLDRLEALLVTLTTSILGKLLEFVLKPNVSLHLWINHERPSIRVVEDDSVLNGELVLRKTLTGPLTDLDLVSKHFLKTDVLSRLDVEVLEHLCPSLDALLTIVSSENSKVGHDS